MFIDYAKIYIKSGKGGDGCISFRRELYVPNGGPNGGDGGNGGSIILKVDNNINTLIQFKNKYKYISENGENGNKNRCHGKNGKDLIINVPNGTIVRDTNTNKIIIDMTGNNKEYIILKGGRGGLGNMHFATSKMQAPKYAKPGESSKELYITLELKVIAEVGLLGLPNVGKSTLISHISNAKPEIANYPFTTINPHLGVVKYNDLQFVMADIPGIIEGASEGVGLGFKFLKHIERTKILLHIIDVSNYTGRDPFDDYNIIINEIKKYNNIISKKHQIVALNKIDAIEKEKLDELITGFKEKYGIEVFPISTLKGIGIDKLLKEICEKLKKINNENIIFESEIDIDSITKSENNSITVKYIDNKFFVTGEKIKKMIGYTNFDTEKGLNFLQDFMKKEKIIEELKKEGLSNGDTVVLEGYEFEFTE